VEFPDHLTQGETLAELEENLRDLYRDLTSGEIPDALGFPGAFGIAFRR
jgi:predicted RNase H-like HicB family nuclease